MTIAQPAQDLPASPVVLPVVATAVQPGVLGSAHPDAPAAVALRRLRWHARRGLLENDLMLARFFDRHEASLDAEAVAALERLLLLPDTRLLDLALGRAELEGELDAAPVRRVLELLRAA